MKNLIKTVLGIFIKSKIEQRKQEIKANIVGTPGSGFGAHGEGFFRLTAFGTHENTLEAIERIKNL